MTVTNEDLSAQIQDYHTQVKEAGGKRDKAIEELYNCRNNHETRLIILDERVTNVRKDFEEQVNFCDERRKEDLDTKKYPPVVIKPNGNGHDNNANTTPANTGHYTTPKKISEIVDLLTKLLVFAALASGTFVVLVKLALSWKG